MDIDAVRITHLIRGMEDRGCSDDLIDAALTKSNLSRAQVHAKDCSVPYETEALFVREACSTLEDITFGAAAGLTLGNLALNSLAGYIGKYSRDLRRVVENTARFHDLIDPALLFSLRVSGNSASMELGWKDAFYAKYHRHTEFLVFGALSRLRSITETSFFPVEVRFDHEVGPRAKDFERLAGFPIVFGAERPEIIFSLSSLNIQVPTYDLQLRKHLSEYGERLLDELSEKKLEIRSRVVALVTAAPPGEIMSAHEVSVALGMSPRSFSRNLQKEGTSYREIIEELRYDLAKTFLRNGMALSEVAFLLAYRDQAAFSAAFKRWHGTAPSKFLSSGEAE